MTLVLVLAAVGLLSFPAAAGRFGRRLPPSEWARVAGAATWFGWISLRAGLLFAAAPTVLRAAGVREIADACHRVLGPPIPDGIVVGWLAALVLVVISVAGGRAARTARRVQRSMHVESWLGEHQSRPGFDLVIVPTSEPMAYAVSGEPPQVVVSRGLVDVLGADELEAVVSHELCHLRHHHQRYLSLVATIDAAMFAVPASRRTTAAVRLAIERWADETACAVAGSRGPCRRALLKCAASEIAAVPTFTSPCTVSARLSALQAASPRGDWRARVAVVAPATALGGVVVSLALAWAVAGHHDFLGMIGYCPL